MNKPTFDQAEGLRRLIARPAPRVLTLLSANGTLERLMLLTNLTASLAHTERKLILLETAAVATRYDSRLGIDRGGQPDLGLIDVAAERCALSDILHRSRFGFDFASLNRQVVRGALARNDAAVNASFMQMAKACDITIVSAELDAHDELPLAALDDGEIMIQVLPSRHSIMNAYALIKRLVRPNPHAANAYAGPERRTERQPFGIIVTGASESEAETIFNNLSQAASRHLDVELNACGSLPKHETQQRLNPAGRAVLNAFSLTQASAAMHRMAEGLAHSAPPYSASHSAAHLVSNSAAYSSHS